MSATWLRRALLLSLVAFCASHLPGCADMTDRSDGNVTWDAYPKHQALPARWVQVETMPRGCYRDNFITHACAIRDYAQHVCTIYSPDSLVQAQAGDVKHEFKHCEGYGHSEPVEMPSIVLGGRR